MAFELGDHIGKKKSTKDYDYAYKKRPLNMLERSQNVPNEKTRASWDRMFEPPKCKLCPEYSDILGGCHPTRKHQCDAGDSH